MEYFTKAWQHRLYSFNRPIQICWQALTPPLNKTDSPVTNLQAYTSLLYFNIVFVQDTFVYIKYPGTVHASIHVCARSVPHTHTHTHTCTCLHTINTFNHTLHQYYAYVAIYIAEIVLSLLHVFSLQWIPALRLKTRSSSYPLNRGAAMYNFKFSRGVSVCTEVKLYRALVYTV